jgi:hypothetical protein
MFNTGQLVWVWLKGEEPSTALVVEVLENSYYNLLIEEQIYKLPDDRIWVKKEDCYDSSFCITILPGFYVRKRLKK